MANTVPLEVRVTGNAAAMRGALETIRDALKDRERDGLTEPRDILERHIVEQALAAPVRNCDRFATPDEAMRAFAAATGTTTIDLDAALSFAAWLFALERIAHD